MSGIYSNMESQHVVAAQPQPAKATSRTPSYADTTWLRVDAYADTTWLRVDAQAIQTLKSIGKTKIAKWTGKNLQKIIQGKQDHITVRDARIINLNAKETVINITLENVIKCSELFDKTKIFNLACKETIFEKKQKGAMIRITSDHRTKLRGLSLECKRELADIIGENFYNFMKKTQKLSEEHAKVIHQISGQIIFDLPNAKGAPALHAQAQGTKRPLAVPPEDPSELRSKRQKTDTYDVNAQIPQVPVFNAQPTLSQEPQFTPLIETNGSENSLSTVNSSLESDELNYFDPLISVDSSSTADIQEILPFQSIYENWDSLNM
jgi:hypothetical protein